MKAVVKVEPTSLPNCAETVRVLLAKDSSAEARSIAAKNLAVLFSKGNFSLSSAVQSFADRNTVLINLQQLNSEQLSVVTMALGHLIGASAV